MLCITLQKFCRLGRLGAGYAPHRRLGHGFRLVLSSRKYFRLDSYGRHHASPPAFPPQQAKQEFLLRCPGYPQPVGISLPQLQEVNCTSTSLVHHSHARQRDSSRARWARTSLIPAPPVSNRLAVSNDTPSTSTDTAAHSESMGFAVSNHTDSCNFSYA